MIKDLFPSSSSFRVRVFNNWISIRLAGDCVHGLPELTRFSSLVLRLTPSTAGTFAPACLFWCSEPSLQTVTTGVKEAACFGRDGKKEKKRGDNKSQEQSLQR